MAYEIDKTAIATANPKVDLAKVEEALALHRKIKESGVLKAKDIPELLSVPPPTSRKQRRMRSYRIR